MALSYRPYPTFHPHDSVKNGIYGAAAGSTFGFIFSSAQNVLQKHNAGALGVFTRTGGTIAVFGK